MPEIGLTHVTAFLVGALGLALALWLAWRLPTGVLLLALAALAIRPQIYFGAPEVGVGWGLHQTLLLVALLVNAAKHGIRKTINWPILALAAVFALNLAFADLDPKVDPLLMASAFGVLALPWTFTQVVLAPGSRRVLALTIASLAILSVAIEAALALQGMREFFTWRLQGMTGNAAVFALLAFTGFAVALHESTRRGRPLLGMLAAVNLALVVLSATRMAIFTSVLFLAVYVVASPALREQWRKRRIELAGGAGLVVAAVWYYWPMLRWRTFESGGDGIRLSGRDQIWPFYYDQFLHEPGLRSRSRRRLRSRPPSTGLRRADTAQRVSASARGRRRGRRCGMLRGDRPVVPPAVAGDPGGRPQLSDRAPARPGVLCRDRQCSDLRDRAGAVRLSRRAADPVRTGAGRRACRPAPAIILQVRQAARIEP